MTRLELIAVEGLPEVRPGDDLGELISSRSRLETGDVIVVAQKVVSKSEGRLVSLRTVKASDEAVSIASRLVASPDPRMVQVVLDESVRVLRSERALITETRHGFVCANGGVDHSNVPGDDELTLLPEDPDASASRLRGRLKELAGVDAGVIVSDTFGLASRAFPPCSTCAAASTTWASRSRRPCLRSRTSWRRLRGLSWARRNGLRSSSSGVWRWKVGAPAEI